MLQNVGDHCFSKTNQSNENWLNALVMRLHCDDQIRISDLITVVTSVMISDNEVTCQIKILDSRF